MSAEWFAVLLVAVALASFLFGRWRGIKNFEELYMPALDDSRARTQWLVDNWPEFMEDDGITFPDGLFWPVTKDG